MIDLEDLAWLDQDLSDEPAAVLRELGASHRTGNDVIAIRELLERPHLVLPRLQRLPSRGRPCGKKKVRGPKRPPPEPPHSPLAA